MEMKFHDISMYITKNHFDGFFRVLCEFVRHCNKRHIFACFFDLFGRNEAIICRIRSVICYEWHFCHLPWGFPSFDFFQLRKMMPVLAFNFIIVATNAWRGKWSRHSVAPFDIFLYRCHFCPLSTISTHYEEVVKAIIKAIWTEQCWNP